jgi:hypothetical protein
VWNEEIRIRSEVANIAEKMKEARLGYYGLVTNKTG